MRNEETLLREVERNARLISLGLEAVKHALGSRSLDRHEADTLVGNFVYNVIESSIQGEDERKSIVIGSYNSLVDLGRKVLVRAEDDNEEFDLIDYAITIAWQIVEPLEDEEVS